MRNACHGVIHVRKNGDLPVPALLRYLTVTSFAGIDQRHFPHGQRCLVKGPLITNLV